MPRLREVPSLRPMAQKIMDSLSAAASPFCRPEEDPFLLLESTLRSIEVVLMMRRGQRDQHQVARPGLKDGVTFTGAASASNGFWVYQPGWQANRG